MTESVIITGGAGFIGSNFVRHVLESSESRVVVLDKLTYAGSLLNLGDVAHHPRFTFVRGDIGDRAIVDALLAAHRPRSIVNFAAETHVDRSIDAPRAFVETNIVGTFELLAAALRHFDSLDGGDRARFRFLQVSTDEVYGAAGPGGSFAEGAAYAPSSPYAATKASADHLVRAYHETYGLPTLTTASSNNFGPYQYPEKLIPLMILNALEGRSLPLYGDGLHVRDWIHVGDHCEGLGLVLARGRPGASYNLGGGNPRTNLAVVDALCDALDRVAPAAENPALASRGAASYRELKTFVVDRPAHDRRYAIDSTRMQDELGWRPRRDLATALDESVAWYCANRAWCDGVVGESYHRERLGLAASTRSRPRGTPSP